MSNYNVSYNQYKYYGAGSRPSEQIPKSFTCKNRGWPHEPIILAKVTDGTYLKFDYFSGKPHVHMDRKEEELN